MELPFKYLPFIEFIIKEPMFVVIWATFGVPLLMFILFLLTRLYKNVSFATNLNTIIFSSLSFTWIAGFIISIVLLFSGVSGIKLYFIWITLCVSSFIFSTFNNNAITKLYDDFSKKDFKKKK